MAAFDFVLNGQVVTVADDPVQTTLLDFIRSRGLTGAREGCAEGGCGACAVVIVDEGPRYRTLNSCLMWLPMAAGREIYTVEALAAHGELAEVQRAMMAGGSQCGYCTPGFVMSLFAEQYRPGRTGPCDPQALGGNLCRCTGYRPIRDAALSLGPAPDDDFRHRLTRPVQPLPRVDYRGYRRPQTLAECWGHGAAAFVAGGTDVGVESNLKGRRWPTLVDLTAIPELRRFEETDDAVRIGAALPLSRIGEAWPVARPWLALFASPTIRHRATLGGNLATASPIGDAAPFLLSLDAVLHLQSGTNHRTIPLRDFFLGYRRTALTPGELIVSVEIPQPMPALHRFYKVAKRGLDDISTVAAGFALERDAEGRVTRARLAFGGVAATPVRVEAAEQSLVGSVWDLAAVARAQAAIASTLTPMSDHRGSAAYRLAVAQSLVEKFWFEEGSTR